jgi:hypothetical protein
MALHLLAQAGELHGSAIVKKLITVGRAVAGESTVSPIL